MGLDAGQFLFHRPFLSHQLRLRRIELTHALAVFFIFQAFANGF